MDEKPSPFTISVPESSIQSLKEKLSKVTYPDTTKYSNDWSYGAPLEDVQRLAAYWKDGYDWRAQETQLNKLPQYITRVSIDGFDDLEIHFIHQRSSNPKSIPLLFCHGCRVKLDCGRCFGMG